MREVTIDGWVDGSAPGEAAVPSTATITALVYGARAGSGGLGLQAATAAVGLALAGPVCGLGPGRISGPARGQQAAGSRQAETHLPWLSAACLLPAAHALHWEDAPLYRPSWLTRQLLGRFRPGRLVFEHDEHLGRWAASRLETLRPARLYTFTQVGLEVLQWAKARGIPTALDNPNGHIRGFARVCREEWAKWIGGRNPGHPTDAMIERVEREYELTDRIRVSSVWAKQSMVRHGVAADKVSVCPQPVDLSRFQPPPVREPHSGPLRVVYVGSLDVRKGFVYLLRAARAVGPNRIKIELVGGTGDRGTKRLLAVERIGLDVEVRPGDPVRAYQQAELFVLPTLEDGFGFAVAEAMACGLPVVVTDQCGAAAWVQPGITGWVVPAGDQAAVARVLQEALDRRDALPSMGQAARRAAELRDPAQAFRQLADWFDGRVVCSR